MPPPSSLRRGWGSFHEKQRSSIPYGCNFGATLTLPHSHIDMRKPTLKEIDRAMIRVMMAGLPFDTDLTPYIEQIILESGEE